MALLAEGAFLWFPFDGLPSVIGVFIVIRVSEVSWWTQGVNLRREGIFYVSMNCWYRITFLRSQYWCFLVSFISEIKKRTSVQVIIILTTSLAKRVTC